MKARKNTRIRRGYIVFYLYMLLILLILLTTASYTWFSLSKIPRVSDMYMYVNVPNGLELSLTPDAEKWELQLDFRDMLDVTSPLRPVTWSEKDQRFYAAIYDSDGRMTGRWEPLNDRRNANKDNLDGYYIKASFYARSGQKADVSLSPAIEVDEGLQGSGTYLIGYPVWDNEEIVHRNGGQGGENAVRIGFRITPVGTAGEETGTPSQFIIYEPNCIINYGEDFSYVTTPSIDGTETLVPQERLILQTPSNWKEAYPVQREVLMYSLGEFVTDPYLFSLDAGEMVRVDLYIWLEGQDVHCNNAIQKAQILASIQFSAEGGGQSGLQPIE